VMSKGIFIFIDYPLFKTKQSQFSI
jgi:hypothetical protein